MLEVLAVKGDNFTDSFPLHPDAELKSQYQKITMNAWT